MNAVRLLACACLLALSATAFAQVSRDEAATLAQRDARGRVLSVERGEAAGRPAWRVKVLTPDGEVRVVLVDVATGRLQ
jgi:uncharacterized membrane protein YkoI